MSKRANLISSMLSSASMLITGPDMKQANCKYIGSLAELSIQISGGKMCLLHLSDSWAPMILTAKCRGLLARKTDSPGLCSFWSSYLSCSSSFSHASS